MGKQYLPLASDIKYSFHSNELVFPLPGFLSFSVFSVMTNMFCRGSYVNFRRAEDFVNLLAGPIGWGWSSLFLPCDFWTLLYANKWVWKRRSRLHVISELFCLLYINASTQWWRGGPCAELNNISRRTDNKKKVNLLRFSETFWQRADCQLTSRNSGIF